MKLVSLTCPFCGAPLEGDIHSNTIVKCKHCGGVFYVDDETQNVNVNFNGQAQSEPPINDKLVESLNQFLRNQREIQFLIQKRQELQDAINSRMNRPMNAAVTNDYKKKICRAALYPLIAGAVFIAAMAEGGVGYGEWVALLLLLLLLSIPADVVFVLPYFLIRGYFSKKRNREILQMQENEANRKAVSELQEQIEAINAKIRELSRMEDDIQRIPSQYLNSEKAMQFMLEAVKTGRAHTIGEVISLYEEKEHNDRMEENIREQTDAIREQARVAKEAAWQQAQAAKEAAWQQAQAAKEEADKKELIKKVIKGAGIVTSAVVINSIIDHFKDDR